ncbi:hypothetical protein BaRGS_00007859 [Batillaria attramentaria]|uniref:Uncharacterized protein n=1 Tax=Batillaria attramentaria TaxID=370345 RepID=A0ABD0LPM2_9CAEN
MYQSCLQTQDKVIDTDLLDICTPRDRTSICTTLAYKCNHQTLSLSLSSLLGAVWSPSGRNRAAFRALLPSIIGLPWQLGQRECILHYVHALCQGIRLHGTR